MFSQLSKVIKKLNINKQTNFVRKWRFRGWPNRPGTEIPWAAGRFVWGPVLGAGPGFQRECSGRGSRRPVNIKQTFLLQFQAKFVIIIRDKSVFFLFQHGCSGESST